MGKFQRSLVPVSAAFALMLAPPLALAGDSGQGAGQGASSRLDLPVLFTANQGQCAPEVLFQVRVPGATASVLADGLYFDLDGAGLRLRFVGAGVGAGTRAEGREPKSARAHFLGGARATRGVETFGSVRLIDLAPGVDLELHARRDRLEYDLVLAPGAEPDDLELALEGSETAWIDADGALCVTLAGQVLSQPTPVAWQLSSDGRQTPVSCAWRERAGGRFGFALGARASGATLVIDPVLVYSSHVGGSNADAASATFVDEDGAVYVAGWARSTDFPGLGARAGALNGKEAVVFKLAPDGRELVFATYLGGRGDDAATALLVDRDGQVLVAGNTASDDFPTTAQALDRSPSGGADGFVAKLAADGSTLLFSTLLGGSAEDNVSGLALTAGGLITLAGTTRSRDFPVSSASYSSEPRGGRDAFVTRLDPEGERLVFSTRLGGSDDDEARGLAVDAEGCTYLTGRTVSHDFPTTLGAFDRQRLGVDAFVAKLSGGGRTLLYSTFLGGSGQDEATAIAIDREQRAVVVGWTQSPDFPFGLGEVAPGRKDGFAVRLSDSGNALLLALPLGGGSADEALGVTLDPLGSAWVVGCTRSADFPVSRDAQRSRLAGPADAFLVGISDQG
ncbi:MAG: hypothetical protein HOP15_13315, partial [Planctomycetes bacterium]|nr:hypothetical protein [Planctomycetota bacterium]